MQDGKVDNKFDEIVKNFSVKDEEPVEGCIGVIITSDVDFIEDKDKDCTNPIKLYAVRSCCGVIESYCISCYNDICASYSMWNTEGLVARHSTTAEGAVAHVVEGSPFSSVNFV